MSRRTSWVASLASVAVLVAVVLGAAGCSHAPRQSTLGDGPTIGPEATTTGTSSARYVALGDSYSSGPGLGTRVDTDGCIRSDGNYAHLLRAERPALTLVDVTCGGATTATVLGEREVKGVEIAPQIDAVTSDTDVVTLGIGGNDNNMFAALITSCLQLGRSDPSGAPCQKSFGATVSSAVPQVALSVGEVLAAIHKRAPDATVVVVGYPEVFTPGETCAAGGGLAAADYDFAASMLETLNRALEKAAEKHDARFADVAALTQGHGICSAKPWVNGITATTGYPFHPLLPEQRAAARAVLKALA